MDPKYTLDKDSVGTNPAEVFASHKIRANTIAKAYALEQGTNVSGGTLGEDQSIQLISRLQLASDEPSYRVSNQKSSLELALEMLTNLDPGHGRVGTAYDVFISKRLGDYDAALKGLMTATCRYMHLLSREDLIFILDKFVPSYLLGGHDPGLDSYRVFPTETIPETENHVLMINSCKYLANQLFFDYRGKDKKYDNNENGLTKWLLGYMHTIAKHDFLEFNSRPYQRYSLHALLNLYEFAKDVSIRTAAQILLDYTMVKFSVSSNRNRRISPFRRLKENTNSVHKLNDLIWDSNGGDTLTGFFLVYVGPFDPEGNPIMYFPATWAIEALIAGLSTYRPPPAAYTIAMNQIYPAFQHRFYHGSRPRFPGTFDRADGGVEIYYKSPSFLLSAGGIFLNSGYGGDETPFSKFKDTSVAQSTSLIPSHVDVKFADTIRFEPYPDERTAVNVAVHLGFACGANLRPYEKKTFDETSHFSPSITSHKGNLLMAWTGRGKAYINTAKVYTTEMLGLDGIENLENKVVLQDFAEQAPAFISHNERMYLAWKGAGNDNLNLMFLDDKGSSFKKSFTDTSHHAPALAAHNGRLFLAWVGRGEGNLNVARISFLGNTLGHFEMNLEGKVVLGDTSEHAPALASHNGRLYLAWKGAGNDNLNLMFSDDDGVTFHDKMTFGDTSHHAPALASHNGRLFLAWTGRGEGNLNVAKISFLGDTSGRFEIEGLEDKVAIENTSEQAPALTSHNGRLYLAWKGAGNDNLNVLSSRDGLFRSGPWYFSNLSKFGFYIAIYRTQPDQRLDTPLDNLGLLYAMEANAMSFEEFKKETLARNTTLPAKLSYKLQHIFNTPDNRSFSFWLQPSLEKYKTRITLIGEEHTISDFTSLPLVEGRYLKTQNDHDGLIQVYNPGYSIAALTLDFRDPEKPVRIDNINDNPDPWTERARALFILAQTFAQSLKHRYEQLALIERFNIYHQLYNSNPKLYEQDFVSSSLLTLSKVGVDFSVPEEKLRMWISNPKFTPYSSIIQAILKILKDDRLQKPVFLDVIVFNYESTTTLSPRSIEDVDFIKLQSSIIDGHNSRYGENIGDFKKLLQVR